ncbi:MULTISPECIES: CMD domain protein [Gluconobacter]|uniref:CMD domain protein n=1 Tax=Gluconobacter TaxID=441 RepID=UPI0039E97288
MTTEFSFEADPPQDLIDHVVGIEEGSWLDILRRNRSVLRDNAQESAALLLNPKREDGFSRTERLAVASFVAGLHGEQEIYRLYLALLKRSRDGDALAATITHLVRDGRTIGPYGAYPQGPLSKEDLNGLVFDVPAAEIGTRLSAALRHAHLLVYHPRDASAGALEALQGAGWSETAIVTLSQLVSFLTFQVRIIHGLTVLLHAGPAVGQALPESTS